MVSSWPLVTEETSAEIQPSSLSSNQTLVPLLYMFSAIPGKKNGSGLQHAREKAGWECCTLLFDQDRRQAATLNAYGGDEALLLGSLNPPK